MSVIVICNIRLFIIAMSIDIPAKHAEIKTETEIIMWLDRIL